MNFVKKMCLGLSHRNNLSPKPMRAGASAPRKVTVPALARRAVSDSGFGFLSLSEYDGNED